MKYVVSKFNDDGSIYPVCECEDEEEAMKTAYACNGVYEKVSPSLTDNQKVVLEWLKREAKERGNIHAALYWFYETDVELDLIPSRLSDEEWCQVLAAFASWGLNSYQNGNS